MKQSKLNPFVLLPLALMIICSLFPVYWTLISSFKTQNEIYSMVPTMWPTKFTWDSYKDLIINRKYITNIYNSVIVSLVVSVGSVFISALAAYAFARIRFRGKRAMSNGILYAYLMPKSVLFIPLYVIVTYMGVNNSLIGLIAIYPTFTIPYITWMLTSYFKTIPIALEEAAEIDGCGRIKTMFRIIFPLAAPGIAATTIFAFTLCWSEYMYALVIISTAHLKTLTLALSDMVVADVYAWGPLMAGSIIATVPVVLIYISMSKYMVSGLTLGGVK